MGRMEIRRKKKEEEAQRKKQEALRKAGFPTIPLAPARITNLTTQEVANVTGVKLAALEQWRREQTEEIRKAAILEAQEKLDTAENYITLCNVMTSLKALDGFRYAKAAANYLLEHYSDSIVATEKENVRKTYEELHEKWGLEMEFDEPDLNKELGFDTVDWRYEYIARNIPASVFDKICDDARNIQNVTTQLSVIWELCEEFGFHKHPNKSGTMLDKFMAGTKAKYDHIDQTKHGVQEAIKLLKQKYDIEIAWSKETQKTIDRFDL